MSDFAEGLISAIAGGVKGGAEAAGDIYEAQRKDAARIDTETQLAEAQAQIQLARDKAAADYRAILAAKERKTIFDEKVERAPTETELEISAATSKVDASRAWELAHQKETEGLIKGKAAAGRDPLQIKAAADAAVDRAEAKVNKKELQGKYAKLGELIAAKHANPKADVSAQWNPLVVEITALGGNPSIMIDTLLGPQTKEQVATKTGDDLDGSVTTTTTNPGARIGGALSTPTNTASGKIKRFVWQNGKLVQQ